MERKSPSQASVKKDIDSLVNNFLSYAIAKSSAIRRYNTSKVIIDQNDLEHMGAVTMIAMLFSDYFNKIGISNNTEKVMRIAITHDLDEVVSGDLPHDAKYELGEHSEKLRGVLEQLSESTVRTMYGRIRHEDLRRRYLNTYMEQRQRKTIEAKIAKLADYIDAILYCKNEIRMGNGDLGVVVNSAGKQFDKMLTGILTDYKNQMALGSALSNRKA